MVRSVAETATTYEPYGEVPAQAGPIGTVYGYTGEQEDSATGWLYLRARYYGSYIYRMLTPDSIISSFKNPQNLNLYTYALNNPVKYVDPSGHCVLDLPCPKLIQNVIDYHSSRFQTTRVTYARATDPLGHQLTAGYYDGCSRPSPWTPDFGTAQVGLNVLTVGIIVDNYNNVFFFWGLSVGVEDVFELPEVDLAAGEILAEQVPGKPLDELWEWYDEESSPEELTSFLTGPSLSVNAGFGPGAELSATLSQFPEVGGQYGFYSPQAGVEIIVNSDEIYDANTDTWSFPRLLPTLPQYFLP